ncbi:histidine--tRNA ligase [Iamia sp.]|uniref:histidine--tRNA ligase n=1 Tax=Iamia sp. TaxID=2722710 RepID=UPI002BEF7EB4|nr:histidine--tRNA ligase [Iamia sp.]HXH58549.1 histidine--tRNA ligase [Iamia sp.]
MAADARPKARLPNGFADVPADELSARLSMLETLLASYRLYGFAPLETPAIEYLDALGKNLPDEDAPDQGVFALRDDDDQWVALRYDLTAPLARYVAQHHQALPTPFRRYQAGPVWRREKPGPGRFRQFTQCDFDTVGSSSMAVDAEACALLAESLERVGIPRGDYEVRVNDRKVLSGILARSGVTDAGAQLNVLRAVDKLDRLGLDGVRQLLGSGRRDASGDVTAGAGLTDEQVELVLAFVSAGDPSRTAVLDTLTDLVGDDPTGRAGLEELTAIAAALDSMGVGGDVVFDPSVVRGLAYYTGPVFEAALTFETPDEKGRPRQFGSVAGGGRYDDLVRRFTGQDVPACGASVGVDRLLAALRTRRSAEAGMTDSGPVVVTVMDRDRVADYQSMVAELRAAGIRAELYLGTQKFAKQLRYADQRGAPVAVIAGENEFEAGEVQLKDLALGARRAREITDRDEWRADQSAQRTVPRAGLVDGVQEILRRSGG